MFKNYEVECYAKGKSSFIYDLEKEINYGK